MPIAYCVRSDPVNTIEVSECHYIGQKPAGVTFGDPYGVVGLNTDKTPRGLGWNIQYDISPVPIGVDVIRSKIVMTADASNPGIFDSRIWQYDNTTSPNLNSVETAIHKEFKWLARARDTSSTELVLTSSASNFDHVLSVSAEGSAAAGQVLILATAGNGSLGSVSMWLRRFSFGSYPGTCVAKIYSVAGSSGLYTKGSLLGTSSARNTVDITTAGGGVEFVFTLPSPLPVTSGQILLVEVSFSPDPTGGDPIFVAGDTGFADPPDNSLVFGPSMQAFSLAVYMNGVEQFFGNGDHSAGVSEKFSFPAFIAGTQYEIGDSDYSPDVTLPSFTSWVQQGLDGRGSSNRLGFAIRPGIPGFDPDPPASGEERRWRSAEHATPQTVDGNPYFGTVLVVEYTRESVGYIVQIADPAVSAGIATASVSASVSGPTAIAQVHSASKAVTTPAAALLAEVQAATLAAQVADPEISAEVATAIIPTTMPDATAVAQVQEALKTAAVGAATLSAQVQAAALVAEVRAATLAVRIAVSPAGGPATEDTVGELLDISPVEIDVKVTRRDSTPFSFTLQDEDSNAINITGYTSFTLTVDPSEEPADATANLFQLAGAFPTPLTGVITFSPTTSDHDVAPSEYYFDVEQVDGASDVRTIIKGKYTVLPDITQP